ncbi:RTA1 like protein-domain-containing protein, partial [Coniella lustricola]
TSSLSTAACVTAIPGKYGWVPYTACNSNYNYNPSFNAAIAVSVIFGILTVTHIVEAIIVKKRYAWVLIMGALWETVAFITGALGAHDQQNSGYATAHTLLFLLAPLWINGFVYMTFSRMVYFFMPDKKIWIFRATGMSKRFVWADVATFFVQAVGATMATANASSSNTQTGLHIYTAGVALQEAFILLFLCLMIIFHRRALQLDSPFASAEDTQSFDEGFVMKRNWKGLLYALYAVLLLVSLRIFYRIAEYARGITPSNPIPFHEVYGYTLDAFPMMICLLILAIMHPGRTLVGPES